MAERTAGYLKAVILLLLAAFFAENILTGRLFYYIGTRFAWLAPLAVGLLIVMAISTGRGAHGDHAPEAGGLHEEHEHGGVRVWPLVILGAPLLLAVIVPARPLGASAISGQSVSLKVAPQASSGRDSLTIVPSSRNVLDWVRTIAANNDPASLDGQSADVLGFVYRDGRFSADQFMVTRFMVACCVADARSIGLLVQSTDAGRYATGSWVQVKGTFEAGTLATTQLPVIQAQEVAIVTQPAQPYLYP